MDTVNKIIQTFEVIAHRRIQLGTGSTDDAIDLASAQLLLEPRLHGLEKQVTAVLKQRGVVDTRVASLRAAESVTAFTQRWQAGKRAGAPNRRLLKLVVFTRVGILAGLDLAGRPDIVGKFAALYAAEAKHSVDSLFNGNVH